MRVRDHVAVSTAGAALLYPLLGRRVLAVWAGSVLIDIDHYLWFCMQERSFSPIAAVRYYNQPQSPHRQASRILHHPLAIAAVALVGARYRKILPVAAGMAVHAALDAYHEARMGRARAAAMRRDSFTCRACGASGPGIVSHLKGQPPLLPSYSAEELISLCGPCHEKAHARPVGQHAWQSRVVAVMQAALWKLPAR